MRDPAAAVMVADPGPTASTFPSATRATPGSLEDQVMVLGTVTGLPASSTTTTESTTVSPGWRSREAVDTLTLTGMETTTWAAPFTSPTAAVTVASPDRCAVTLPASSTVAVCGAELDQATFSLDASMGFPSPSFATACSGALAPLASRTDLAGSTETDLTDGPQAAIARAIRTTLRFMAFLHADLVLGRPRRSHTPTY